MQTRGGDIAVLSHGGGVCREASPDLVAGACRAEGIEPADGLLGDLVAILDRRLVMVDCEPVALRNELRDDVSARRSRSKTPAQEIEKAASALLTAFGGTEGSEIEIAAHWYFEDRTRRKIDPQDLTTFLLILSECRERLFHSEKPANGFYCVIREMNAAFASHGVSISKAALARVLVAINADLPGAIFSPTHTNFDKVVRAALAG